MSVVFVLFRWSTSFFSVTRDLSTLIKVPIKQFTFAEEDSVENLSALIRASYSCQSGNWKKCCSYCFRSIINLVCIRHYIFEFLKRDLKWKQYHCRGILKWQLVDYVPCIRILIVPIFRRKTSWFCFSRYSNSTSYFTHTNKLYFFHQAPNQKFSNQKRIGGIFVDFVPCNRGLLVMKS